METGEALWNEPGSPERHQAALDLDAVANALSTTLGRLLAYPIDTDGARA